MNEYFIPVFVTNEDYVGTEREAELTSIWNNAEQQGLPSGTVHTYIVRPNGQVFDALHVANATQPQRFTRFLANGIRKLKLSPLSSPVVEPRPQMRRPSIEPDQLLLQLQTDYTRHPGMISLDWVVLQPKEWAAFSPPKDGSRRWKLPAELTKKLLRNFYPYAEDWDASKNEFTRCELTASLHETDLPTSTAAGNQPDSVQIALRGHVIMTHNRRSRGVPQTVDAEVVGLARIQAGKKPHITLTTGQARYGDEPFQALMSGGELHNQH